MEIISKEQDITGKYRVLVSINNDTGWEFKFQNDPTDEEILIEAEKIADNLVREKIKMKNTVTQRQLRLWLYVKKGITDAHIKALLNAMPNEGDKQKALIEWEYASEFDREHPLIELFGKQLGMTEQEIDFAFLEAGKI